MQVGRGEGMLTALTRRIVNQRNVNAGQKRKRGNNAAPGVPQHDVTSERLIYKPIEEARGHTGYLTFARRIVGEEEDLEEILPEPVEPAPAEVQT